ncbi:restriction endonuclease subunit S [Dickeya undicola]|uniref:Restriction endonuclease subunit S n=1 Tax=Dickeya undicola TaxID=1577887 RepID=A0A3N0G104_9GAMM|nr:restriction endonuclease subunit S [Dickeya undicola]RNM05936.1 restriction endonuclease subunit S [Dickeya undicola]
MSEVKLPEGWVSCKFTDILDIQGGTQPPKSEFISFPQDGYIRLLQIRDFGKNPVPTYIPDTQKLKKCEKGDLLIGRYGASLGRICSGMNGAYNVALAKVINTQQINKLFLKKYLESEIFQSSLRLLSRSAQNGFNKEDLSTFDFLLIPEKEQTILAEKLDTLLTQVDSIKSHLDNIPLILKKFRQSVLAAAVSGKLTEGWRGFGHIIQHSNYSNWLWKEIPKKWEIDTYERLVESRLGKMLDKAKNSGIPTKYLGNINVRWFSFQMDELQEIQVSNDEINELALKNGDILICEGGEPGRAAIWKGENATTPIIFQKALHRARVCSRITPEWLLINLKNDADNKTLEQLFTGTTIKHLTGKALRKYPLKVPPLEEQTEIVRRVEQLFAYADGVEKQVQHALERVNNLTQSILAKAFRGELTAQWRAENPELISGENSAEALLARIKAERAAQQPQKKTRQKASTTS